MKHLINTSGHGTDLCKYLSSIEATTKASSDHANSLLRIIYKFSDSLAEQIALSSPPPPSQSLLEANTFFATPSTSAPSTSAPSTSTPSTSTPSQARAHQLTQAAQETTPTGASSQAHHAAPETKVPQSLPTQTSH